MGYREDANNIRLLENQPSKAHKAQFRCVR